VAGKKVSAAEIEKRLTEVLRIRMAGGEFYDIKEYANAKEQNWGVSDSQLWRYVRKTDKLVYDALEKDRGKLIMKRRAQLSDLYSMAINQKNIGVALAVHTKMCDLEGLYDHDNNANGNGKPAPGLNRQQLGYAVAGILTLATSGGSESANPEQSGPAAINGVGSHLHEPLPAPAVQPAANLSAQLVRPSTEVK
jgi:hypothetical protein